MFGYNNHRLILAILTFSIMFNLPVYSANYRFVHITSKDGLPHQQISALENDKYGKLWIGTRNGLAVYDGYSMVNYYNKLEDPHSLNHNSIESLYCDSKGRMWVGTYYGISVYRPVTDDFKSYEFPNNEVSSIVENSRGQIICGGSNLCVYDEVTDKFEPLPHEDFGYIISLAVDDEDRLFVATNKSIYYFDSSFQKTTQIKKEYFGNFLTGADGIIPMMFDSEGRLWIGRNGKGVMSINMDSGHVKIYDSPELSDYTVRVISEDMQHNIWLGAEQGVAIIKPDGTISIMQQNFIDKNELNDNAVYDILCDANGNVWIGTYFGGINALLKRNEQFNWVMAGYDSTSLYGKAVREIIEPKEGLLWIATEDGGLNIYDTEKGEISRFDKIPDLGYNVHCLHYDSVAGQLWIGTFLKGLFRYSQNGQWERYLSIESGLDSDAIFAIDQQTDGRIWVGTTQGLRYYNKGDDVFEKIGHPVLDVDFCYCLLVDDKDNLWVGTRNNGVFCVKSQTGEVCGWSARTHGSLLTDDYITCLYQDSSGKIWVGTNNDGIRYIDTDDFELKSLGGDMSLRNNTVCSIIEDNAGCLWISTSQGLFQFYSEHNAFKHYTIKDGLPVNQFNFSSSIETGNGLLYFGSVDGLVFFDPKSLYVNNEPFEVHLWRLIINNQVVTNATPESPLSTLLDDTEEIMLSFDQSRLFTIEYGTVSVGSINRILYQVRLDGVDENWRNVGETRQFMAFDLSPGDYMLHVRANNSNSGWDDVPIKSIGIKVGKPFYLSAWAYVVYAVIFMAMMYLYYRFMVERIKVKDSIMFANMEKEKSEELIRAKMDFFTAVSHELKTPLSLIKAPLNYIARHQKLNKDSSKRLEVAIKNTDKMIGMINELVQFNKVESGDLQFFIQQGNPLDFIESAVRQFEDSAKEKGVDLYVNCENNGEEVWFSPLYVERITNNLVSNALKFTHRGGRITVKAEITEKDNGFTYLRIKVDDTGIGIAKDELDNIFIKYYQTKRGHNVNNRGWGLGLALVKRFAEVHKGSVSVESEIGKGSTFIVFLNVTGSVFPSEYKVEHDKTIVQLAQYKFDTPVVTNNEDVAEDSIEKEMPAGDDKVSILIVEDNGELLKFLVDYFSASFNVYTAKDGKEALNIACKYPIQLVISDVMMPEMDGYTLCHRLKNDISTSHILVILLTAKNDTTDVLKGYECGAEAYVPKPFDPDILELQVKNILRIRQHQQERNVNVTADSIKEDDKLNKFDKDFINRIKEIVEKNIDNDQFSITDITSSLAISRSLLHVKMKSLFNMSMGDYIKKRRFDLACKLLKEGYNVSETAYKTGFADPNYFSKAFKKEFGLTPSEFIGKGYV